jgi:rhomboid protease GluP
MSYPEQPSNQPWPPSETPESTEPEAEAEARSGGLPLPLVKPFWVFVLLGIIILVYLIEETLPRTINLILPYISDYAAQAVSYLRPRGALLPPISPALLEGGSENSVVLILLGANFHPAIQDGQVWRFFTSMFLHIGLTHLFFNVYALFIFGGEMERLYGHLRFILISVLSGLFGSLLSYGTSIAQLSAGASGAIFGIIGMQVAFFLKHKKLFGDLGQRRLTNTAIIIGINLFLGFTLPGIDNMAHLGGLAAGVLLGYAMAPAYEVVDRFTANPRVINTASFWSQLWAPLLAVGLLVVGTIVLT